ncbi:hypothetical protein BH09PSE5_BH09PSE5_32240 [soil metagenome]
MMMRRMALAGLGLALTALAGCANLTGITSDVTSYSQWPADRKPASYTFERLPSQQAQPTAQDELEQAARVGLEQAGFVAASNPSTADVNVQLSSRVGQYERSYPYDRFGFYGGYGAGRLWGPGVGIGMRFDTPYYEREVSVLIRDRRTGQSLYESRARNDGNSAGGPDVLQAMFEAALKDFPQAAVNPRRILIEKPR